MVTIGKLVAKVSGEIQEFFFHPPILYKRDRRPNLEGPPMAAALAAGFNF